MKKLQKYSFSELQPQHRMEVTANLGDKTARKTVWELVPDYPVDAAATLAWDTSISIFDHDIESLMGQIKDAGEVLRPIIIDELDYDAPWMEGHHRAIASEELGLKTIPALIRIE